MAMLLFCVRLSIFPAGPPQFPHCLNPLTAVYLQTRTPQRLLPSRKRQTRRKPPPPPLLIREPPLPLPRAQQDNCVIRRAWTLKSRWELQRQVFWLLHRLRHRHLLHRLRHRHRRLLTLLHGPRQLLPRLPRPLRPLRRRRLLCRPSPLGPRPGPRPGPAREHLQRPQKRLERSVVVCDEPVTSLGQDCS